MAPDSTTLVRSPARPNVLTVDLGAVDHNVRAVRDIVGPGKEVFAALKGNAYGYGLLPVGRQLVDSGADGLAVVHVADAVALRKEGIAAPLLLYGGNLGDPGLIGFIEDHDLTATIVDQASAELHGSRATRRIRCFLKVDVGLERLGAYPADAMAVARTIRRHRHLSLEGVYTHMKVGRVQPDSFGCQNGSSVPYAEWQLGRFQEVVEELRAEGFDFRVTLAASSPAIVLSQGREFTAVDPGRLLYGLLPPVPNLVEIDVRPAFVALKSRLIQLKTVNRQQYIEEAGFELRPDMRIGVLPMGYGDGLGSVDCGEVLLLGRRAAIIGISLEHARIDVSAIPEAQAGDEVVIVGRQGSSEISVEEVIEHQGLRTPAGLAAAVRETVERRYRREATSIPGTLG
ncbi:alanine racemase [Candidatus Nephthysia bennettiae]|uniref:Alanine racemase n=1 Tax=Candidatus Nephthysia bennettiae TaxID=3127016 RepID=A0A934N933_9BACT|nr:alanine racemase [Candidatus Dormibacteraeota bacterium]